MRRASKGGGGGGGEREREREKFIDNQWDKGSRCYRALPAASSMSNRALQTKEIEIGAPAGSHPKLNLIVLFPYSG
jgi:hypothetical protein